MYELTVTTTFDAAHRLRNYSGKCSYLHGHTWKVEVSVKGPNLDDTGMLIDFSELKKAVNHTVDQFDHNNLNETEPFSDHIEGTLNPTAENLAGYIFRQVSKDLSRSNNLVKVEKVTVWESSTSRAVYYEEEK